MLAPLYPTFLGKNKRKLFFLENVTARLTAICVWTVCTYIYVCAHACMHASVRACVCVWYGCTRGPIPCRWETKSQSFLGSKISSPPPSSALPLTCVPILRRHLRGREENSRSESANFEINICAGWKKKNQWVTFRINTVSKSSAVLWSIYLSTYFFSVCISNPTKPFYLDVS